MTSASTQAPAGPAAPAPTITDAMADLTRAFREAGFPTPELDARLLTTAAARVSREDILRTPDLPLSRAAAWLLEGFKGRRLGHEPVSRILGVRDFYGRSFRVTLQVLDPRPETETLVDAALEVIAAEGWGAEGRSAEGQAAEGQAAEGQAAEGRCERRLRILDVGTGTGCILLTLLAELPAAHGLGSDVSQDALELALDNAEALGLSSRASFDHRRSLLPRLGGSEEEFDIMVSNPPYIPSQQIGGLDPGVRDFDPRGALDGGVDGLDVYRELASGLLAAVPCGWALFEVGAGQAADVIRLLQEAIPENRLSAVRTWHDLAGLERCVAVRTQL